MKDYLSTNIRHALTFLAGGFTWLFNKGLLTADEAGAAQVKLEGFSEFIAPLIAVVIVRVTIMFLGKIQLPGFLKRFSGGVSVNGGSNLIIVSIAWSGTALACIGLVSCSATQQAAFQKVVGKVDVRFTPDRCLLASTTTAKGNKYYAGACLDGRVVARWDQLQLDGSFKEIRYTRFSDGNNALDYWDGKVWLSWSDKSGVQVGEIPVTSVEQLALPRRGVDHGPPIVSADAGIVPAK